MAPFLLQVFNKSLLSVIDCNIGVIGITDHALVGIHINTSLSHDEQFAGEDIRVFLDIDRGTTERLATVWDALKAFIRGKCIAYSSWKKKDNKEKVQLLKR